jgi:hypothetical protein
MSPLCYQLVPFNLHVLGTPPAFVLSQDQTLNIKLKTFTGAYFLVFKEQLCTPGVLAAKGLF